MYRTIAKSAHDFFHFISTASPSVESWGYRFVSSGTSRQLRRIKAPQPAYETCEPRRLLAGIVLTAATGQVVIGGTGAADVARVTQSGDTVTFTQEGFGTQTFTTSEVTSILFVGLGGDDFFENQTSIPSLAFGQNGNDTLIGGSGNDRLVGNNDDDIIRGNAGDDFLVAGNGNDFIDAGVGNDRVLGVNGDNRLEGGAGDDRIFGGNGADTISDISGENIIAGRGGDDSISGGSDRDLIYGGPGDDFIRGFGGDDFIYAQAGNDIVSGGSGVDVVAGNDGDDQLQGEQGNDRIVGGPGNDRASFSGALASYDVFPSGPNLRINDLRGSDFGLNDLVISVEDFAFGDGVRTSDETLNPTPPPPGANIREVVTVQPIIAANSDGSNQAEFFGNAQQQADILARIDEIFDVANVDIEFLPARRVNDTFFNVGNNPSGERPSNDLDRIVSSGDRNGLGSSNPNVIDIYFVEQVPAFRDLGDGTANGLAFVGSSGIAMHVGDDLVRTSGGRATIAEVTAHEIGHNLGLSHVNTSNNLLVSSGSGTNLTDSQINTILGSSLSRPVSATSVELDSDFVQGTASSSDNAQADSSTSSIGGCGGCGVCAACTGGITLS